MVTPQASPPDSSPNRPNDKEDDDIVEKGSDTMGKEQTKKNMPDTVTTKAPPPASSPNKSDAKVDDDIVEKGSNTMGTEQTKKNMPDIVTPQAPLQLVHPTGLMIRRMMIFWKRAVIQWEKSRPKRICQIW